MRIRLGKSKDKKEYLEIRKEALPTSNLKRESNFFDDKVKKKEIFILEDKGKQIGHIAFGKYLHNAPFAGSIFIEEFTVREKFRNKGFGTMLIEKLVNYCNKNNIKMIHLSTGDYENNKALNYYKRQGFKKVGYLRDLEPDPEYDYDQIFYAVKVKDWKNPKDGFD